MKIWIIGRSYPLKKNKMRGSFELEQAKLLADRGHEVTYLAIIFHPVNRVHNWGLYEFTDGTVHVLTQSIPFAPERMHIHSSFFRKLFWRKLLKIAESKNGFPDVIHIHYPGMNGSPEVIEDFQSRGARIVLTEHWTKTLTDSMDRFQRKQLIEYVHTADKVLCVGEPLKQSILKITNTKKDISVVPNVVSNLFQNDGNNEEKDIFSFIAVGRLAPVKQMDQIALAFCEEFLEDKKINLIIVGGGNERKKIEQIVCRYGMMDRVSLLGTKSREETAKLVQKSDCLICFSRLETFGVPVIEAWSCGKPVIASDCLGFLEYYNEKLGVVVKHDNLTELKDAMRKIVGTKDTYNAEEIAKFANDYFGEQAIYNRLIEEYTH